jgi:hypothetical protein
VLGRLASIGLATGLLTTLTAIVAVVASFPTKIVRVLPLFCART